MNLFINSRGAGNALRFRSRSLLDPVYGGRCRWIAAATAVEEMGLARLNIVGATSNHLEYLSKILKFTFKLGSLRSHGKFQPSSAAPIPYEGIIFRGSFAQHFLNVLGLC